MNCKPGDLVVVVRTFHRPQLLGRPCEVLRFCGNYKYLHGESSTQAWVVRFEGRQPDQGGYPEWPIARVDDSQLRSITPPPGSVTEDEVNTLYSPHKEVA